MQSQISVNWTLNVEKQNNSKKVQKKLLQPPFHAVPNASRWWGQWGIISDVFFDSRLWGETSSTGTWAGWGWTIVEDDVDCENWGGESAIEALAVRAGIMVGPSVKSWMRLPRHSLYPSEIEWIEGWRVEAVKPWVRVFIIFPQKYVPGRQRIHMSEGGVSIGLHNEPIKRDRDEAD